MFNVNELANTFGQLNPNPTSIKLYDLPEPNVMIQLAAKYGFTVKLFSKDNPKTGAGYDDGILWIYDPSDSNGRFNEGALYAFSWRIVHELGHALTESEAVRMFGPTNRKGRFPMTLTATNAKQAVWWEVLTIIKQHELLESIGVKTDRITVAKELNTTIFDSMVKILTGNFSNPDELGFVPAATMPNWRDIEGMIDGAASHYLGGL